MTRGEQGPRDERGARPAPGRAAELRDPVRALDALLAAMPGAERAVALRSALIGRVERGELRPRQVQPSVALGEGNSFRLIVDAGQARMRHPIRGRAILESLLTEFSIPRRFSERAALWTDNGGELFLGVAIGSCARTKIYFRHGNRSALSSLREEIEFEVPEVGTPGEMLGLDFGEGRLVAVKRYVPSTLAKHDAELRRFLGNRDLRAHLASRYTSRGRTELALHVQVEPLGDRWIGVRWAEASGASEARVLAGIQAEVRVISEVLGATDGRHVYLAPEERPRAV
jgi:hypothetical protein